MKKTSHPVHLSAKQSARLGAYFAAGIAASMGASEADAAIVYFDVNPDQTIGLSQSASFGSINLNTETYAPGENPPSFTLFNSGGSLNGYANTMEFAALSGFYMYKLDAGATISGAQTWSASAFGGYWLAGDTGYIGLRIDLSGGNYNYGWAAIAPSIDPNSFTITGFAFEKTVNAPIEAGAVPEPSTVALAGIAALVLGGSAYVRSRRRREEEQKEAA